MKTWKIVILILLFLGLLAWLILVFRKFRNTDTYIANAKLNAPTYVMPSTGELSGLSGNFQT